MCFECVFNAYACAYLCKNTQVHAVNPYLQMLGNINMIITYFHFINQPTKNREEPSANETSFTYTF
jgi:hypothetical protein